MSALDTLSPPASQSEPVLEKSDAVFIGLNFLTGPSPASSEVAPSRPASNTYPAGMTGDTVLLAAIANLIPVFVCATIFAAPAVYIYFVRYFRLKEKELDLTHDKRLTSAEQERDMLRFQLEKAENELEFLRRLVPSLDVKTRVAAAPEIRVREVTATADEGEEETASAKAQQRR
jgi:hypothetical protein